MGLPEDLGLKGNEFGNAVTLFFATYVAFEAPCSIALKIVGPKNLLSFCMLGWGLVCLGMGFIKNAQQLYACRLLIGLFEAGLIPCINAYIGMVYLRSEMSVRSAIMYGFSAFAGAVGGLLASAVSNVNAGGLPSWSWLFIIEGIITVAMVPVIYAVFPKDPRTAWFFNEEERNVMRLRFELNPHLSMEDKFTWGKVASAFKDPKMYLHAVLEFSVTLSLFSFMTFLPAIIRGLGYASVHAQLITVPVYVWATASYLMIAFASDRVGLRSPFILGACLALIIGYSMNIGSNALGVRLAAVFVLGTGVYATVSPLQPLNRKPRRQKTDFCSHRPVSPSSGSTATSPATTSAPPPSASSSASATAPASSWARSSPRRPLPGTSRAPALPSGSRRLPCFSSSGRCSRSAT